MSLSRWQISACSLGYDREKKTKKILVISTLLSLSTVDEWTFSWQWNWKSCVVPPSLVFSLQCSLSWAVEWQREYEKKMLWRERFNYRWNLHCSQLDMHRTRICEAEKKKCFFVVPRETLWLFSFAFTARSPSRVYISEKLNKTVSRQIFVMSSSFSSPSLRVTWDRVEKSSHEVERVVVVQSWKSCWQ